MKSKKKVDYEARKDAVKQLVKQCEVFEEDLENSIERLKFISMFCDSYSDRNFELIESQCRGARCVGSFNFWKEKGYSVNKGEKGIKILVPAPFMVIDVDGEKKPYSTATKEERQRAKDGELNTTSVMAFKTGNVFDISQTNYPRESYPQAFFLGEDDDRITPIIEGLIEYVSEELGYDTDTESDHGFGLRGTCNNYTKELSVNKLYKGASCVSTLTHEIGHAVMNHRMEQNLYKKESEADIFGIILTYALGVDVIETRKIHFKDHYSAWKGMNKDLKTPSVFTAAYKAVKEVLPVIEQYVPIQRLFDFDEEEQKVS